MAETIKQSEGEPASWPDPPSGLTVTAAAIDPAIIWARIEHYIARRFSERSITWIVEGVGHWNPPLAPATIATIERWVNGAWEEDATLSVSPYGGYLLSGCGPYRFTGTVGEGPAPAIVLEAYRRLAEYFAGVAQSNGIRQETVEGIGSQEYDANAVAKGMVASGAGDLLRSYRRAA